jgi:endogenous inhibitor of DNA gyrase (YacG/DUF329 family)
MTTEQIQPRQLHVDCPACGAPAEYGPHNLWRPFCSERCRRHDFSAWACERYRVQAPPPDDLDCPPTEPH